MAYTAYTAFNAYTAYTACAVAGMCTYIAKHYGYMDLWALAQKGWVGNGLDNIPFQSLKTTLNIRAPAVLKVLDG